MEEYQAVLTPLQPKPGVGPSPKHMYEGVHVFRVVASILVVVFHAFLYWAGNAGKSATDASDKLDDLVNQNIFLKLISFSNISVDALIVLSGFLAGRSFLASREFSFRRYLQNRIRRILFPYWSTLVATWVVSRLNTPIFDPIFSPEYCPRSLLLSPVLLNNFVGFGACGVHLWSVAVQFHLFVLFGLMCKVVQKLYRPTRDKWVDPAVAKRRMVGGCSVIILVISVALRVVLAIQFSLTFPPPPFDRPGMTAATRDVAMRYYHVLYFFTPSRLTNFFVGVLMSLAMSAPRTWSTGEARILALVTSITAAAYLSLLKTVDFRSAHRWGPMSSALLFHGSPVASLVMALLLASSMINFGQWEGRPAIIPWLSDHSYLVYLIHPLLMRLALHFVL